MELLYMVAKEPGSETPAPALVRRGGEKFGLPRPKAAGLADPVKKIPENEKAAHGISVYKHH